MENLKTKLTYRQNIVIYNTILNNARKLCETQTEQIIKYHVGIINAFVKMNFTSGQLGLNNFVNYVEVSNTELFGLRILKNDI